MGIHQGELFLLGLFTLSLHLVPQVDIECVLHFLFYGKDTLPRVCQACG